MTQTELITLKLGIEGRMISGSKSGYMRTYPDRNPVFNANIVTSEGKVWHGDLDLVSDEEELQEIANGLGENIYILREMDARFETENDSFKVMASKAVATINPK